MGLSDRLPELPQVLVPEASFDWYQPGEAARCIESAANEWERAVLMFPLHTGARMGEQRAIRWSDVDFALQRIHIRQSAPKWLDEEKAPKSNRHRWVDLTPELAAALRSIRGEGQLVFCKGDGGKLSPGQFREILAAAPETVGPSPDQVARAAALVRVDPDDGRGTASDRAIPAWSLVDQDDGALRASGSGAERSLRAPALRSRAAASLDGRSGKWAPGGPGPLSPLN